MLCCHGVRGGRVGGRTRVFTPSPRSPPPLLQLPGGGKEGKELHNDAGVAHHSSSQVGSNAAQKDNQQLLLVFGKVMKGDLLLLFGKYALKYRLIPLLCLMLATCESRARRWLA